VTTASTESVEYSNAWEGGLGLIFLTASAAVILFYQNAGECFRILQVLTSLS